MAGRKLLSGNNAVKQTNNLPLAIDLSPHVSLECFRRNPYAIRLASAIVDEGRRCSDITTSHRTFQVYAKKSAPLYSAFLNRSGELPGTSNKLRIKFEPIIIERSL